MKLMCADLIGHGKLNCFDFSSVAVPLLLVQDRQYLMENS
jgi:hypothetical protein